MWWVACYDGGRGKPSKEQISGCGLGEAKEVHWEQADFSVGVVHPAAQDLYPKQRLYSGRRCCLPHQDRTNELLGRRLRPWLMSALPGAASRLRLRPIVAQR
ncbi:hypothetical protein NDU88_006493 [Pleurodeles waltl]|uniref:Uncharacterized protein n=1 Tax=Pleurodeles waltl TaxID=8319 RepID=A0AAV7PJW5_PLEWA|nr:hypothetical protein NDU88_006493 [Pleurodeles waltl]